MRFYEVSDGRQTVTHATLASAHKDAKERPCDWRDIVISEVEVKLDKDNVLALLNNMGGTHIYLRKWDLSPRKGLRLCSEKGDDDVVEA